MSEQLLFFYLFYFVLCLFLMTIQGNVDDVQQIPILAWTRMSLSQLCRTCESIDYPTRLLFLQRYYGKISLSPCITCWFTQLSSLMAQSRHRAFNCSLGKQHRVHSVFISASTVRGTHGSSQCCVHTHHISLSVSLFPILPLHQEQERFYM